jgi:hypothetical protein
MHNCVVMLLAAVRSVGIDRAMTIATLSRIWRSDNSLGSPVNQGFVCNNLDNVSL